MTDTWNYSDTYQWMSRVKDGLGPVIITCAVNGGAQGKESSPVLPETPEEIAAQVFEAYQAGAAMVHVHTRAPENLAKDSQTAEAVSEVNRMVRRACPDIIINNTTAATLDNDGSTHFDLLDALPEVASINLGPEMVRMVLPERPAPLPHPVASSIYDDCWPWTYGGIEELARAMKQRSIKPEMEVYHPGQYWVSRNLIEAGLVDPPYLHQFVMGYQTSIYPTPANLLQLLRELPADSVFSVLGIGPFQLPMNTMSLLHGGHVRVGLEDNLYYRRGQKLKGNGEAVERAVRIATELGREIATPAQARSILGLPSTPRQYP